MNWDDVHQSRVRYFVQSIANRRTTSGIMENLVGELQSMMPLKYE